MLQLETDFIKEFPVNLRTNRDAENPSVIEFIKNHPSDSLLDIGAHNSWANYAPEIRKLVSKYSAIDILPDPETQNIVEAYFVDNANTFFGNNRDLYDTVISVSVFEHAGLSTYKADHETEVLKLFETCLKLAKKYAWVSFDCGQEWVTENEHSPITLPIYEKMLAMIPKTAKVKERFFYTQGSQANHPWYEHTKREVAFKIPYIFYIGNQSIAVLEIEK